MFRGLRSEKGQGEKAGPVITFEESVELAEREKVPEPDFRRGSTTPFRKTRSRGRTKSICKVWRKEDEAGTRKLWSVASPCHDSVL